MCHILISYRVSGQTERQLLEQLISPLIYHFTVACTLRLHQLFMLVFSGASCNIPLFDWNAVTISFDLTTYLKLCALGIFIFFFNTSFLFFGMSACAHYHFRLVGKTSKSHKP